MIQIGKRKKIVKEMAFYFAELGYIPTAREYTRKLREPGPYKMKDILKVCDSYSRLIKYIERDYKDLLSTINSRAKSQEKLEELKKQVEPKPKAKAQPKAKPAAKVASKKEK